MKLTKSPIQCTFHRCLILLFIIFFPTILRSAAFRVRNSSKMVKCEKKISFMACEQAKRHIQKPSSIPLSAQYAVKDIGAKSPVSSLI